MTILHFLQQPWPWYVAGPIIGLSVPLLLLAGNKVLGISSSLRQFCAMCFPGNISFLNYNWREQIWQFYFVGGLFLAGIIGGTVLKDPSLPAISTATIESLKELGIAHQNAILPTEIFSWQAVLQMQHLLLVLGSGFLVGFGTRWAGGCTSGHGIYGLATLQWPSLVAVITFFASGILTANFILPLFLN